jgi:hypothetical protein
MGSVVLQPRKTRPNRNPDRTRIQKDRLVRWTTFMIHIFLNMGGSVGGCSTAVAISLKYITPQRKPFAAIRHSGKVTGIVVTGPLTRSCEDIAPPRG